MNSKESRFSIRGQAPLRILLPPVLVLAGLAAVLFNFDESTNPEIPRDGDLCPIDRESIAGSVMFLFDFTKPLDPAQATLPGDLLRDVTANLERDTEVQVFSLTDSPSAPRTLLKRLCKPYDQAEGRQAEAEDRHAASFDCDDVMGQATDPTRAAPARFCAAGNALQGDLNALAGGEWPEDENVTSAYLVEAFEDIRLEFAERPGPHRLYVFSDMMQHARWYSQLDLEWTDWNYDKFAESLESRNWMFGRRHDDADMRVDIFYLPRAGTTDEQRAKEIHQKFWQSYFGDTGIAFHDQPSMPAYAALPRMNVLSETEIAARERTAIEQLLLEIQREREVLEREQRQFEAERQRQIEAQSRRLAQRQQELESQRMAQAERERAAAKAEALRQRDALGSQQSAEQAVSVSLAGTQAQQSAEATPASCQLQIPTDIARWSPDYPKRGRIDFGNAQISVRYVVDESGATLDDEVSVVAESSSAVRRRYFQLFAHAALEKVRSWTFSFADPNDEHCTRRQTRTTSFEFRY